MMKKMNLHTKNNKKLIVTAICVATLGAQLAPVMNVQAATDNDASPTSSAASSTPSATPAASNSSDKLNGSTTDSGNSNGSTGESTNGDSSDPTSSKVTGSQTGSDSTTTPDDKAGTTDTTKDKDVAAPVVVTDPTSTQTVEEAGYTDSNKIQAQGHIEVTNDSGTAATKGTQDYKGNSIIESNDANKISAVYTLTDDVPAAENKEQSGAYPTLYLPGYFANSQTAANIVVDKGTATDATDWQTTLLKNSGLPASTNIKYTQGTANNSQGYESITTLGKDFDVSKITGIQIVYNYDSNWNLVSMPANTTYTITVPLKVVSNDPNNTNVSKIGVSDVGQPATDFTTSANDYGSDISIRSNRTTSFRIADKEADVKGQLGAVTEQKSNADYEGVDPDIQALMPTIEKGDVSYQNFADSVTDSTESSLYSGGKIIVNDQALEKVAKAVNDKGYSLLMNNDGSIGTGSYVYQSGNGSITVTPNPNSDTTGTSSTSSSIAPYVYITLRQLLDTKDSDMTVGDSWDAANSLADVTTKQDKATPATAADLTTDATATNHVTTKISDPNGVLDKAGKAIKSGSFQVTYMVQDGNYTISKTATITVKAGENTSSHNSGSTTGNKDNGGSTTTNNGGNGSSTDTNTIDPDTPVISPNEVPDVSDLTGNNITDNTAATGSVETTNNSEASSTSNNVATRTATTNGNQATPVYTVGNNTNGVLTGYTPTNQTSQQSATAAKFPQTGNSNDSKLQVIGTMIISMMATVAGFAFGRKHHAEKA